MNETADYLSVQTSSLGTKTVEMDGPCSNLQPCNMRFKQEKENLSCRGKTILPSKCLLLQVQEVGGWEMGLEEWFGE